MRKKNNKKPRNEHIYATTTNMVESISLSINQQTGEIEFETDVEEKYLEVTYDREKGEKVISRVPQNNKQLQFNHNFAIEENYEIIFAIDTNTRKIKNCNISISGIVQTQPVFAVDTNGVTGKAWQYFTPFCMEFIEVQYKPENFGWIKLIEHIESEIKYSRYNKIGIIVDSDLENIKLYNSHQSTIYENFFLPKRMQLIYASSDSGRDLFANQMLKYADKASTQCLVELEKGNIPINTKTVISKYCSGYRHLLPKH